MRLRTSVAITFLGIAVLWITLNVTASIVPILPKDPLLGGLSGVTVSPDGQSFTALGDRGMIVRGRLERTNGTLTGATQTEVALLLDQNGNPYVNVDNDSEGMDIDADGNVIVVFEHVHRVALFGPDLRERRYPPFRNIRIPVPNAGFESLALDDQQRPVVIIEGPIRQKDQAEIMRLEHGIWRQIGTLQLSDGFVAVGADFGPDGALYVLERKFGLVGFRSRLKRVQLVEDTVMQGEIIWAPTGTQGNLEGISIWQDDTGNLRAVMVADDNFLPLLPGGITEITLAKKANGG